VIPAHHLGVENQLRFQIRYSSVRNSHITEEIKQMISTKQAEVEGAITTGNKQLIVLESKLDDLNLSSDDDDDGAIPQEDRNSSLRQLEEELKGIKAAQKLLTELLSKAQEEAVAKAAGSQSPSTNVTFGAQNSGIQAHTINGGVSGNRFGK